MNVDRPATVEQIWEGVVDEPTTRLYQAYSRPRHVGSQPAVVAVDLYRLAYAGGDRELDELAEQYPSSCGKYAWAALDPTRRFLDHCRRSQVPVVFTTGKSGGPAAATMRQRGRPRSAEDYAIMDGLRAEGDPVVEKDRASAFFDTGLLSILRERGAGSLIVLGESTSGCVRATAVDGYSHGFHVVVVADLCFDRSPVSHRVSLFDLHHKYADVMLSGEVGSQLGQPTPESNLVGRQ